MLKFFFFKLLKFQSLSSITFAIFLINTCNPQTLHILTKSTVQTRRTMDFTMKAKKAKKKQPKNLTVKNMY